jgi:hypothetical protein
MKVSQILIDPSGFLAEEAYAASRGKVHFCRLDHPISLNPMRSPYKPFQIAEMLVETINQMVLQTTPNQMMTAKMLQIFNRHVVENLGRNRYTLAEVRASIEAEHGDIQTRDGILARLDLLLQDEDFKQIICGGSSVEINQLIDRQESFILDCSGMGTAKKIFIGTLLTNLLKAYFTYSRPKERKPLVFMVDEAHNFVTPDFALVLKEGRKHLLATVMATTDFSMMPKQLIHTILSNAGTLVCLRAGHVEAQMISNEFTTIKPEDIKSLEKYHAAVKTPDTETIIKLPLPLTFKPIPIKKNEPKKTFNLDWFDLEPYQPAPPP